MTAMAMLSCVMNELTNQKNNQINNFQNRLGSKSANGLHNNRNLGQTQQNMELDSKYSLSSASKRRRESQDRGDPKRPKTILLGMSGLDLLAKVALDVPLPSLEVIPPLLVKEEPIEQLKPLKIASLADASSQTDVKKPETPKISCLADLSNMTKENDFKKRSYLAAITPGRAPCTEEYVENVRMQVQIVLNWMEEQEQRKQEIGKLSKAQAKAIAKQKRNLIRNKPGGWNKDFYQIVKRLTSNIEIAKLTLSLTVFELSFVLDVYDYPEWNNVRACLDAFEFNGVDTHMHTPRSHTGCHPVHFLINKLRRMQANVVDKRASRERVQKRDKIFIECSSLDQSGSSSE